MAPPVALLDEIFEEILLRVPPDDPARFVHSALVCKTWFRLVSGPRFRRRYSELHGAAPMLGFFGGLFSVEHEFVSTSSFRPPHADDRVRSRDVVDSRHGRVLLHDKHHTFMVWDPSRLDRWIALPEPEVVFKMSWNAAVLCAANTPTGDCDHLDCQQGPFLVVYLARITSAKTFISVYSSKDGSWSDPIITSGPHVGYADRVSRRCALVGNAVHFSLSNAMDIIQYNLGTQQVSFIQLPLSCLSFIQEKPSGVPFALMTGEDGRLELATVDYDFRLCVFSREYVPHRDADAWVKTRVIEVMDLLFPGRRVFPSFLNVVGAAADGVCVIFLFCIDGTFTIDLKSGRATKIYAKNPNTDIRPYMSFYPPVRGLASESEEEPSTSASGV